MRNYAIEIKWGFIFVLVLILWMMMEKALGWHDEHIAKHSIYTMLFVIPAFILIALALIDKRENFLGGTMSYKQGIASGIIVSVVVAVLSPFAQYIISNYVSPDYFNNMVDYVVDSGQMSREQAENHFSLQSYMLQSAFGALVMGIITSAIVALFVRKK